jgi:large subunit ribosomal protein L31
MKTNIHPKYEEARVTCACGELDYAIDQKDIHVEICSACHPFFTGKRSSLIRPVGRAFSEEVRQEDRNDYCLNA